MARFPFSHKQSRVRVVPRLFIVDTLWTLLHRDVDKLWKPLSRNGLQESTPGKEKAFFFSAVYLLKKKQILQDHRVLDKGCCIRLSFF